MEHNKGLDSLDRENEVCCPWCGSYESVPWGRENIRGFNSALCLHCDTIYVQNRYTLDSLGEYYSKYLSQIHQSDSTKIKQREIMYELDYGFIKKHLKPNGKVLDVGCSNGKFLDLFNRNGFQCSGIEFGKEAASVAGKKYKIYIGEFPKIDITEKFDLVIFRGVIEHVIYPQDYLSAAHSLLNSDGIIFITATPNRYSYTCELYQEHWNQHFPEVHLFHVGEKQITNFLSGLGMSLVGEKYFYEETPYASLEDNILEVAEAIKTVQKGEAMEGNCPPFYKNMLTLAYKLDE